MTEGAKKKKEMKEGKYRRNEKQGLSICYKLPKA